MTGVPGRRGRQRALTLSLLFATAVACGGPAPAPTPPAHSSTGATCPPDSTLTYENFAEDFFAAYCTRCHSVTRTTTDERHGATPHYNWDDLDSVRQHSDEIDGAAAGGPKSLNRIMPPTEPRPTDDERFMLGEWLACGAP